jgi:DNA-directed RNA polymerase specialized sigma24 family protein
MALDVGTQTSSGQEQAVLDIEAALLEYGPVLLAHARVLARNPSEAEDLVQTTYELALRNAHQLRNPESVKGWLLRIETREALRVRRRLARFVRWDGHSGPALDGVLAEHVAVRQALDALPTRMRAAVALHHLAGMTVADTATTMGISPNSAKTLLKIGLARIRERLEQ